MKKIISIILTCIICLGASVSAFAVEPHYTSLGVPSINSSWKTWMDYGTITSRGSAQWNYLRNWCWIDWQGFVRCNAERDLGITDDYYAVAMGSYYGSTIGTKYRITLDTGKVIYCVLCDQKANIHTNGTSQYGSHNDILEFLVNTYEKDSYKRPIPGNEHLLNWQVKRDGTANVYMPLNGSISKIERIDFN